MTLKAIPAARAKELVEGGALLVDIREADEFRREHIAGARARPLSTLHNLDVEPGRTVVFSVQPSGCEKTTAYGSVTFVAYGAAQLDIQMDGAPIHVRLSKVS